MKLRGLRSLSEQRRRQRPAPSVLRQPSVQPHPRRRPYDKRHLRADQLSSILNAWAYAKDMGMPLNAHIVIHWERLNLVAEKSILGAQSLFLDRLGKWLRRRERQLAFIWT